MCVNFSRAQEKIVKEIRFPYSATIKSKSFQVQDVVFGKTPALVVTNDYVVVVRTFTEPLFQIFSLLGLAYLGGVGRKGKGPDELEFPDARTAVKTNNGFKVFDVHKGYMYVDITGYKNKKEFTIKNLKVPGELYILNDAIQLNDSIIIGLPEGWKTDKLNVMYNIHTGKINYFGSYPTIFPERYKNLYWGAFWRHSVAKPDGTKFASYFNGVKMFRIYNASGRVEVEKIMKVFKLFEGKSFSQDPKKVYYNVVRAGDKYIYALDLDEYREKLLESYPAIEIWDWQGNPVARLTLDHHIQSFDISPDGNGIYAFDREITNEILYYDLHNIVK